MPSPEPHDGDLLSLAICKSCGHRESCHDDLGCFLRPDGTMRDEYSDGLETRRALKGTSAECWCRKYETDLASGIDAILKDDAPRRAIVAATDAAVDRKDAAAAEKLLYRYLRETVANERDAHWVKAIERSIDRLRFLRHSADYSSGLKQSRPPRPVDAKKELIARLKARYPSSCARKICELIDKRIETESTAQRQRLEPLLSWVSRAGTSRTWLELYEGKRTHNLVRSYVNKVPPLKTRKSPK